MEIQLKRIYERNFVDAFNLKLADGQEAFISHPIRSLAQAYVYYNQCTPFGIYDGDKMVGYVMVIYDYDIPEYDVWHMMIDTSCAGYAGNGGKNSPLSNRCMTKRSYKCLNCFCQRKSRMDTSGFEA